MFAVVSFKLQGKDFTCLPSFNNYIFFENNERQSNVKFEQKVTDVIAQLFRRYKNSMDDFVPADYFSESGEFITNVSLGVNVQSGNFSFEDQETPWFYSRINDQSDFEGAVEIEKVGENLNNLYPSNLKRAYYREQIVDQVFNIVYKNENTPLVLIGPEGVGKSTILHELVFQYLNS